MFPSSFEFTLGVFLLDIVFNTLGSTIRISIKRLKTKSLEKLQAIENAHRKQYGTQDSNH